MPERTALYRLYDAKGVLLYVGIARDPKRRWKQHAVDSDWWPQVTSKTTAWFDRRESAEQAERVAIKAEGPLFNRAHVPTAFILREGEVARDSSALYKLDQQREQSLYIQQARTGRPLYGLIADSLRDDITAGRLCRGDRMPTYHALRKRFGTSLGPIIAALDLLADEGHVERRPGRRGAYVSAAPDAGLST
ncbi:GntR family transcriptional regulator [Streptomyces asiaticus]